MTEFTFPEFFEYPPYFTVQPTPETQGKQVELWKSLIHRYCQHHRAFVLDLDDDAHPLFSNPRVNRKLNLDARRFFVDELVKAVRRRPRFMCSTLRELRLKSEWAKHTR